MINTKPIKAEQKDNQEEGEVDMSVVSNIEDSLSTSIEDQFEHLKLSLSLAVESTIRNVISF